MASISEAAMEEDQPSLPAATWDEARMERRVGTALCLIPALYLGGVTAFGLANAEDFMADLPQRLRYVIVPGFLLTALSLTAFKARPVWRLRVGGIASGLLFALFLFEAFLEVRYLQIIRTMIGSEVRRSADSDPFALPPGRTVKQLNKDIGITQLSDAVLGAVPGSVVDLCRAGNIPVKYRADRFGFRNPPLAAATSAKIMLVGDSFVEGICLPNGQDIAGRVRARENAVLSLGTRGAGPLLELALLGRYGPVVRPEWSVIVFYEGNDWQNLERELQKPWLAQALDPAADFGLPQVNQQEREAVRTQIARWDQGGGIGTLDTISRGNVTRNFLALHQTWVRLGLGYPKSPPDIPQFELILQRARALASGWGGRVAMVYLPQNTRFMGLLPNSFAYDSLRNKVLKAAQQAGVPAIDMTPYFGAAADPIVLFGEHHLSPAGADMVARVISTSLRNIDKGAAG
jgi:hypothetical protein